MLGTVTQHHWVTLVVGCVGSHTTNHWVTALWSITCTHNKPLSYCSIADTWLSEHVLLSYRMTSIGGFLTTHDWSDHCLISIYHHMIDLITAWSISITTWLSIMLHIILVTALFVKLSKIKKMVSSFFIIITSYKCLFLICYVCHCRRQYIVVLGGVAQSCWEADQRYSHSRLRPLTVSAYTKETHLQPNVQPHSVYY